jgi:hypothetical protein
VLRLSAVDMGYSGHQLGRMVQGKAAGKGGEQVKLVVLLTNDIECQEVTRQPSAPCDDVAHLLHLQANGADWLRARACRYAGCTASTCLNEIFGAAISITP